ncbi:MAG: beta-propeller fold lactonase family protein [Proteobacteria bacterium]|nr:beta-propeller fold lactonase family protein [Pseudomonadota bacterium]
MRNISSKAVTALRLATVVALAIGFGLARAAGMTGFAYSGNERDASISEIALATGQVRTFTIPIMPHNVQVTPDGAYLLAVGMPAGDHGKDGAQPAPGTPPMHEMKADEEGKLLVFDVRNLEKPAATLPAGEHPAHVVTDRQGRRAFVTDSGENRIIVLDLARHSVIGKVRTGAYPHGLRPSPDGRELYVANVEAGSVSVVDTKALKEVARIPVGKGPVQVAFTPDGHQVYVTLRDENAVAVVDAATRRVIGKIAVGRNPIQVYATPDGKTMYVANQGTAENPDDKVSVIDVATRKVIATVTTGAGAHGVVVGDAGRTAFVTNVEAGTVSAIDTASQQVNMTFKVGAGPNGITYRKE